MKLKIKYVILYPKDHSLKPRFIKFDEKKVNVITGYSQRGKSALIPIIDYCLCSGSCNIPIGPIQNTVDKFALYINLNDQNIFIARDAPINTKSSDSMYLYNVAERGENSTFNTCEWIEYANEYKYNRDLLKKYLNSQAGFLNIATEEDGTGFDGQASFRDTMAFVFQTQNIIANPSTMFYKMDSYKHFAKLQRIFPLILGYKSFDILKLENEIYQLLDQEKTVSNKIGDIRKQYENWQSDVYQYYMRALELGLTNTDININTAKVDAIRHELSNVVFRSKQGNTFRVGSSARYSEKLNELDIKRSEILRQLDDAKIKLSKLERFDRSKDIYVQDVAEEVEQRLKPIDWFLNQRGTSTCPFCNYKSDKAIDELLSLQAQREKNKDIIKNAKSIEYSFEKEKRIYEKQINELEKSFDLIDGAILTLEKENAEDHKKLKDVYEFVGKVEHVIENLEKIAPSSVLQEDLLKIQEQLRLKTLDVERLKTQYDRKNSLEKVSTSIGHYLKMLPIEDKKNRKVFLDPEQSGNIRVQDTRTNNFTYLSKIGSGANHMCYHLATMMGLHDYFSGLPKESKPNYVPSFLVLDQPSQVYFPEEYPTEGQKDGVDAKKKAKISEDIENTIQIFKATSEFIKRTKGQVQIIVLEHAPISTWQNIPNIHLVAQWRGKEGDQDYDALIPQSWLDN
jgi:Protein of unknown function (DUF3732)